MTIKAIETIYNGYRFRSRLEARWAVFFDALGIRYEYEPEGFDLGEAGWYLPDFWLPDQECWFEVKGKYPGEKSPESRKAVELAAQSGYSVFEAIGGTFEGLWFDRETVEYRGQEIREYTPYHKEANDYESDFGCSWQQCSMTGSVYLGRGGCPCGGNEHNNGNRAITRAFRAARQARFEHGERGM